MMQSQTKFLQLWMSFVVNPQHSDFTCVVESCPQELSKLLSKAKNLISNINFYKKIKFQSLEVCKLLTVSIPRKEVFMQYFFAVKSNGNSMQIEQANLNQKQETILSWVSLLLESFLLNLNKKSQSKDSISKYVQEAAPLVAKQAISIKQIFNFLNQAQIRKILINLKEEILQYSQSTGISQDLLFLLKFSFYCSLCKQLRQNMSDFMGIEETIISEQKYFSCLNLIKYLHLENTFACFINFLTIHSIYAVLEIITMLNPEAYQPSNYKIEKLQWIDEKLDENSNELFRYFWFRPYQLSYRVLLHYLSKSGLKIPSQIALKQSPHKLKRQQQNIVLKYGDLSILDPLHFLLIKRQFWIEDYSRRILEVSLWIVLETYSQIVQLLKLKKVSDKQIQQYLKQQQLAVIIFLLRLPFPTNMLQYYPIEHEILKQLFSQPIIPGLILENQYFFKIVDNKTQEIRDKVGRPEWILPWSHMMLTPKNICNYVHFQKGFELVLKFIKGNNQYFEKEFGDLFITVVTTELQNIGINLGHPPNQYRNRSIANTIPESKKTAIMTILSKYLNESLSKNDLNAKKLLKYV